jgi:hypothetical protein
MKTKKEKSMFSLLLGWKIRTYKQIAKLRMAGKTDINITSDLLKSKSNKFSSDIIECKEIRVLNVKILNKN